MDHYALTAAPPDIHHARKCQGLYSESSGKFHQPRAASMDFEAVFSEAAAEFKKHKETNKNLKGRRRACSGEIFRMCLV